MEEDVDAGAIMVVGISFTGDMDLAFAGYVDLEDSLDSRGVHVDLVDQGKEYKERVVFIVQLVDG